MQAAELSNRRRRRRAHRRSLTWPDEDRFIHSRLREELLQRLEWTRLEASRVLDLGCGTGGAIAPLRARYPNADIIALDHYDGVLARVDPEAPRICSAAEALPLPDGSVDLVFASLTLAYCPDLPACLAEARRVLRAPGLFSFVTLGRDAFLELGRAWATADQYAHIPPQPDMHDLGDLLVQAGFSEPVLDTDMVKVSYGEPQKLWQDLRAAGAANSLAQRNPGLTGRGAAMRLEAALRSLAGDDGRFDISLELVFGHAWAATAGGRRRAGFQEISPDQIGGLKRR
jgi:malonyl-CoA O-methyltransferase